MKFLSFIGSLFATLFSIQTQDQIKNRVEKAIANKEIPGAVVLVMHQGNIAYHKAFGNLMIEPEIRPTLADSLYDLTSLTKLYTSTLIMQLYDEKLIDIKKPVANYVSSFNRPDKKTITIEHLLLHYSGLPIVIDTRHFQNGLAAAVDAIAKSKLVAPPGELYLYSDLGSIVASFIAETVTNKPFDVLLYEYIFEPLGLTQTCFVPKKSLHKNTAPTTGVDGKMLLGIPWSPRTQALGGIGGHSGLFSCAQEVAIFGQLFLDEGMFQDKEILSKRSIKLMTMAHPAMPQNKKRCIGFDINTDSGFARGTLFGENSFGHSGTSGTALWIDPDLQSIVVVLTNRSHPSTRSDLKQFRSDISDLAAKLVKEKKSVIR